MQTRRHILSALLTLSLFQGFVFAQEPAQQPAAAPAVTAAPTESGARFTAPGEVLELRLEVFTADGAQVFDSGTRPGGVIDFQAAGFADGQYTAVVTVKDLKGRTSRRTGSLTAQGGKVSVSKLSAAQATAPADAEPLTALKGGKERAATVSTHDGTAGQVTSTSGDLKLSTGDVFTGQEREQVRVTADGRVGVGTSTPEDTLDVNGTIRARGGIRFDDGTVLTSAAQAKTTTVLGAVTGGSGEAGGALASGAGTANRLARWLDGSGTLGDANITQSGNNVGIGISAPTQRLHVVGTYSGTSPLSVDRIGAFVNDGTPETHSILAVIAGNNGVAGIDLGDAQNQNQSFIRYNNGALGERLRLGINNIERLTILSDGNVGVGAENPTQKLEVAGSLKLTGAGSGIMFPDGTVQTTAGGGGGGQMSGTSIVSAINDAATVGVIADNRHSANMARLNGANAWSGANVFGAGLSANNALITNVGNPVNAGDATNKAYTDANFVKFVPGAEQLSVGDANGTAPMINLRGGSTCCSGPGGHTPAWFKVFQNGSFVATGNLGIGVSPMQGKGYRTSWDSYKGAFRSGYADNEWDDANVGFFSWAGGSNSTAIGLYALAFGDTNSAESTSSIVFGSGNQVKGAAGISAGAGNHVCDTYGVAFGNKARSGGPLINGKCDPDTFNVRGLAAVAIGYNVTADQDHTTAMGKFATNNGFTGTFIWSDGSAQQSADTFRNTANNEFAARATGGFRFRTNLGGTTGCNLPAGSGVFNCTSSRTTKENFFDVDGDDVLARLRKVPVSTWNYISEGQQSRHLGPMAEDFYSAFRLGTSDKAIGVQDAVGVSLAAVKALDARTLELQQKTEEVEQLRTKVNTLEQRLAALEALVQQNAKQDGGQQK
jgi:hypothetical protein